MPSAATDTASTRLCALPHSASGNCACATDTSATKTAPTACDGLEALEVRAGHGGDHAPYDAGDDASCVGGASFGASTSADAGRGGAAVGGSFVALQTGDAWDGAPRAAWMSSLRALAVAGIGGASKRHGTSECGTCTSAWPSAEPAACASSRDAPCWRTTAPDGGGASLPSCPAAAF